MKVGVALPCTVVEVTGKRIAEWARAAEQMGFSSLAVPDRVLYENLDPMMTLAAAAAVTERIGLVTGLIITPLRRTALFAKEVGTLSALAPGRVTIGVGIGNRIEDYQAVGVDWKRRGAILDQQMEELTSMLAGEPVAGTGMAVGPPPTSQIDLLVGGGSPQAIRRMVRWGHGFIAGGISPRITGFAGHAVRQAFKEAGRTDEPRVVADVRFFSGEQPGDEADAFIARYQATGGPPAEIASETYRGATGIRTAITEFEAAGAEELIFSPVVDRMDELEWLADVVKS